MTNAIWSDLWVQRLGWTLIHFLWQGAAITGLYALVRAMTRSFLPAQGRYALACVALAVMLGTPAFTFLMLARSERSAAPAQWALSAESWQRYLPAVVAAWVAGVAVFSARLFFAWRFTARLRATAHPAPPEWQEKLREVAARVGSTRPARLLVSSLTEVPTVIGWLKPVILVPLDALTGAQLEQIAALLAHELAHIRRQDYLASILQSIAEALLFYHPAVWWISRQIRIERELCCDDIAVAATGDAVVYARALADLESRRAPRPRPALAATGGSLLERIRRLAGESQPLSHGLPSPGTALALSLLCLAGMLGSALHADQPRGTAARQRVFAMPRLSPRVQSAQLQALEPPPLSISSKIYAALLFDPLFAPPRAPAPPVADGQEEEKKFASLSGTVSTTAGKPVGNVTVRLLPVIPASQAVGTLAGTMTQSGTPQPVPLTRTDAAGKFSLERIPPGSYTIQFQHKDYLRTIYGARPGIQEDGEVVTLDGGGTVTGIDAKLPETAAFVGRTVDEDGDPIARADMIALVTQYYYGRRRGTVAARSDSKDDGAFRIEVPPGRYYLVADTQPTWSVGERAPVPAGKPGQQYVRPDLTHWGGVHHLEETSQIEIGPGQVIDLGKFKMGNVPIVHVRGKVVGNPAQLQGARVVRVPGPGWGMGWGYGADIQPDGSFDMANMWPDSHTIAVYSRRLGYLGWQDIVVQGEDLEKIQLNAAAVPLSGSVSLEGAPPGSETAVPPARIELVSTGYYKVTSTAQVKPDGTFSIPSVAAGTYILNVTGLPSGCYMKSARFGPRDLLDQPLDWGGQDNAPIEIAISQKAPVLDGSLADPNGKPVSGTVTLVPEPQRPGFGWLYPTAKADRQGNFRFRTVAPGVYKVYAWESILDTAHWSPEFIRPFAGQGERIDLKEGDRQTLVMKRISAESMADALRRAGL